MNKKPVVIAVIDSGIDTAKASLDSYVKTATGFRINEEGYIVEAENMPVKNIHGTAIAMIIRQLCRNVAFISINVLNERLLTDMRVLLVALEQALMLKPDIIHLSLGTKRFIHIFALRKIIRQALRDNITIVAATNNDGSISYPAYQRGVIGVKAIPTDDINALGYDGKFFLAPLTTNSIDGINELKLYPPCAGTSMSAAYITGHIAGIIDEYNASGTSEITRCLKLKALNNKSYEEEL